MSVLGFHVGLNTDAGDWTRVTIRGLVDGRPIGPAGPIGPMTYEHAIALKGLLDYFNERHHVLHLDESSYWCEHPYWCRAAGLGNCPLVTWLEDEPDDQFWENRLLELGGSIDLEELNAGVTYRTDDETGPFIMRRVIDATSHHSTKPST